MGAFVTPVYPTSTLKNATGGIQVLTEVGTLSITTILHKPYNMNFIYPDSGLPDFVTQFVTLGEVESIFGMFMPFHDSQKKTELQGGLNIDTFTYPPILPAAGDWYFVENVPDLGPFTDGHVAVYHYPGYIDVFPRSYPIPGVVPNIQNAYQHTSVPVDSYYVMLPIWAWFTGRGSKEFPQFWSDADLLFSEFSDNPEDGKKAVNLAKISKLGLIGVGSRVVVQDRIPFFYVFVPRPGIGQAVYFEIYIGSSYKAYPQPGGSLYLYEDNVTYPDSDLESYEDVRVSVLSHTLPVNTSEVDAFLQEFDTNLSSASPTNPLGPVYTFPSDPTLRALLDYGFGPFDESSMSPDVFTAYYYLREWLVMRGVIFYVQSDMTNLVRGPIVFVNLLRDETST